MSTLPLAAGKSRASEQTFPLVACFRLRRGEGPGPRGAPGGGGGGCGCGGGGGKGGWRAGSLGEWGGAGGGFLVRGGGDEGRGEGGDPRRDQIGGRVPRRIRDAAQHGLGPDAAGRRHHRVEGKDRRALLRGDHAV